MISVRDFLFPVMVGLPKRGEADMLDASKVTVAEAWLVLRRMIWVFLAGMVVYWVYPEGWPLRGPIQMLGEALMVGVVIAFTLELFVSQLLIDKTTQELAEKLVGLGLPKDLQALIGDLVHRTHLVHDQSSIRYEGIQEVPESDLLTISIERRYRSWNYGRGVMSYRPTIGDEQFNRPRFLSLQCFVGDNLAYSMDEHELAATAQIVPESRAKNVFGKTVQLEPFNDGKGLPCSVVWRLSITVPKHYSDVIAFGAPTVGGFEISRGGIPENFEFDATRDANMSFAENGTLWRYHRAFLTKQHLRVWWRPKAATAA